MVESKINNKEKFLGKNLKEIETKVIITKDKVGNDLYLYFSIDFLNKYKIFLYDFLKYYPELDDIDFLYLFEDNIVKIPIENNKELLSLGEFWEEAMSNVLFVIKILIDIDDALSRLKNKPIEISNNLDSLYKGLIKVLKKDIGFGLDKKILELYLFYKREGKIKSLKDLWVKGEKNGLLRFKKSIYKSVKFLGLGLIEINGDIELSQIFSPAFNKIDKFLLLFSSYIGKDLVILKKGLFLGKDSNFRLLLDVAFNKVELNKYNNKYLLYHLLYGWIKLQKFLNNFFEIGYDKNEDAITFGIRDFSEKKYDLYLQEVIKFFTFFSSYLDDLKKLIFLDEKGILEEFYCISSIFDSEKDIKYFFDNKLFEKISSFSFYDKVFYINFFYEYKKFFLANLDLMKKLSINEIKIIANLLKRGFFAREVLFLAENKLLNLDNLDHIRDFIPNVLELYGREFGLQILKLDRKLIKLIIDNKFDKEFIKENILNNDLPIKNIIKLYEIKKFKEYGLGRIERLPRHYKEKRKIKDLIMLMDFDNFEERKKEINKLLSNYKSTIDRLSKLLDLGYDIKLIETYYEVLFLKKNKKNGLKLSSILDIIEYVLMNYEMNKVEEFFDLLSSKEIIISSDFIKNYESIVKIVINNLSLVKEYVSNTRGKLYLAEIEKYLVSKEMYKLKEDLIINLFPEILHQEVKERENRQDFNDLIKIAKDFDLKSENEELVLELIILNTKKYFADFIDFLKFYIKLDIKEKFAEIFGLYKYLEESKKNIFDYLNQGFLKTLEQYDKDIKYWWLNEFIYGSLGPEFFFKEEDFKDEDNEKNENKGLSGLAGFTGKKVLRKLKNLGFEEKRVNGRIQGKGDHILLFREKDGKKQYFLVPMHRQVKASTLGDKLKMVGISKDEFLNA